MKRNSSLRLAFVLIIGVATLCPYILCAENPRNMGDLIEQTAVTAQRVHPQKVLIEPLDGCLLNPQICTSFEAGIKARLEDISPSVQFVEREDVLSSAKKFGFFALDLYTVGVLAKTASDMGVDVLIVENLKWGASEYGFIAEVLDVQKKNSSLISLELKVPRSPSDSEDAPVIIKDPDSGLSLIVRRREKIRSSVFHDINCTHCPDPEYTEAARKAKLQGTVQLLFTLTEQGVLQDIRLVKNIDPTLDAAALEAVRTWKITPAIGFDGKPFAVRTHAEITFKLL
jgi:TonB family protein